MIRTVDMLVLVDDVDVLLIRRAKPPFEDKLVMPGGHVEEGEDAARAAARELEEEIGLTIPSERLLPFMVLDTPNRDPRPGLRISTVFVCSVSRERALECAPDTDAKEIVIRPLVSLCESEIGFDHWCAIERVKKAVAHESACVS